MISSKWEFDSWIIGWYKIKIDYNKLKQFYLRPLKHLDRNEIWNAHSLYTTKLSSEFDQIKKFLGENPYEIVIVDLSGSWDDMNSGLWAQLKRDIDR